jgi:hypothetical protein
LEPVPSASSPGCPDRFRSTGVITPSQPDSLAPLWTGFSTLFIHTPLSLLQLALKIHISWAFCKAQEDLYSFLYSEGHIKMLVWLLTMPKFNWKKSLLEISNWVHTSHKKETGITCGSHLGPKLFNLVPLF